MQHWLADRGLPFYVDAQENDALVSDGKYWDDAMNNVGAGRPTVIGVGSAGSLHYPIAIGYHRDDTGPSLIQELNVNKGWGGAGNGWISDMPWFEATLVYSPPPPPPPPPPKCTLTPAICCTKPYLPQCTPGSSSPL